MGGNKICEKQKKKKTNKKNERPNFCDHVLTKIF